MKTKGTGWLFGPASAHERGGYNHFTTPSWQRRKLCGIKLCRFFFGDICYLRGPGAHAVAPDSTCQHSNSRFTATNLRESLRAEVRSFFFYHARTAKTTKILGGFSIVASWAVFRPPPGRKQMRISAPAGYRNRLLGKTGQNGQLYGRTRRTDCTQYAARTPSLIVFEICVGWEISPGFHGNCNGSSRDIGKLGISNGGHTGHTQPLISFLSCSDLYDDREMESLETGRALFPGYEGPTSCIGAQDGLAIWFILNGFLLCRIQGGRWER
jgi:hypothetical protein